MAYLRQQANFCRGALVKAFELSGRVTDSEVRLTRLGKSSLLYAVGGRIGNHGCRRTHMPHPLALEYKYLYEDAL